ncbi:hypothetical protein T265_13858, partial [Opisthorchis viverrini]
MNRSIATGSAASTVLRRILGTVQHQVFTRIYCFPGSSNQERTSIIIDSMTSVFNTDASLPYDHDFFESVIVENKFLQPGTVRITRSSSWKASSTDSTQAFHDHLHTPLPGQGLATSLFTPLSTGHGEQHSLQQTMVRHTQHLLVLDTFSNGSTRCTTENALSSCFVTDSTHIPLIPTHTSYGSETTIVEHLKTSQFRCSNRPSLTPTTKQPLLCLKLANATRTLQIRAFTSSVTLQSELIQLPRYVKRSTTSSTSPWIVNGVFSDCTSTSMTLHFVGAKCIPKDGMTLVTSSKSTQYSQYSSVARVCLLVVDQMAVYLFAELGNWLANVSSPVEETSSDRSSQPARFKESYLYAF